VQTRKIGNEAVGSVEIGAIGLGEMPLSVEGRPGRERAIRTVHAALDAGVTLVDTADAYCLSAADLGHGEELVAEALSGRGEDVLVATKGGHTRTADGGWGLDGSPEHLRMAGICNADPDQIRTALDVLGPVLVSVQNQFAPNFRSSEKELLLAAELGLAFLPWSPLGGIGRADRIAGMAEFAAVAAAHGVSPQRVTLAWMLAKSPTVVPIPGSSRPETIADSARAADLELSPGEMARLDATGSGA
jgi:aryl-alcohol dehydrogenase-like predicted oxidoreductase